MRASMTEGTLNLNEMYVNGILLFRFSRTNFMQLIDDGSHLVLLETNETIFSIVSCGWNLVR